uniref:Uncharacterized protein n=1 Tax=Glossina austeni TaxID=7395 RepID=A0A1A9VED3_GLOAU
MEPSRIPTVGAPTAASVGSIPPMPTNASFKPLSICVMRRCESFVCNSHYLPISYIHLTCKRPYRRGFYRNNHTRCLRASQKCLTIMHQTKMFVISETNYADKSLTSQCIGSRRSVRTYASNTSSVASIVRNNENEGTLRSLEALGILKKNH